MDTRAVITKVQIISEKHTKILNKRELEQFCNKQVQIKVRIVGDESIKKTNRRQYQVALNLMSPDHISNTLSGNMTENAQIKPKAKSKVNFL